MPLMRSDESGAGLAKPRRSYLSCGHSAYVVYYLHTEPPVTGVGEVAGSIVPSRTLCHHSNTRLALARRALPMGCDSFPDQRRLESYRGGGPCIVDAGE